MCLLVGLASVTTEPVQLVPADGGVPVPLESIPLPHGPNSQEQVLLRATAPLAPGEYRLEPDAWQEGPVKVQDPPGDFGRRFFETRWVARDPTVCLDVVTGPRRPDVAREQVLVLVLSMALGRDILGGARADVWALQPGQDAPADHDATRAPMGNPLRSRARNALDANDVRNPRTRFEVVLDAEELGNADRVAMRVVEPTGQHSGIMVAALESPGYHLVCACKRPPDEAFPASAVAVVLIAFTRGRRPRKPAASSSSGT